MLGQHTGAKSTLFFITHQKFEIRLKKKKVHIQQKDHDLL